MFGCHLGLDHVVSESEDGHILPRAEERERPRAKRQKLNLQIGVPITS